MKTARFTVQTARSPEEAYAYLGDLAHDAEWRCDVVSCELIAGEPGQAGARYRQRLHEGGDDLIEAEVEITRADPPLELDFRRSDDRRVTIEGAYRIEPVEAATEVTCELVLRSRGFLRIFEGAMGEALTKLARRYEEGLAERLG
jgi:predicted Ser/Thr protein kinase